jgi:hypothetical protein
LLLLFFFFFFFSILLLQGSIPTASSFEVWTSKYHVVLVVLFSVPQIMISLWELVAIVVSSYGSYGQIHVGSIGAIGGDSNQIRGASNSAGWWFGEAGSNILWVSAFSDLGALLLDVSHRFSSCSFFFFLIFHPP